MEDKNMTIIIDESGTLPDPNDRVIIIAAVGTKLPERLSKLSKELRKKLAKKNKKVSEIKFYRAGKRTKKLFLSQLAKEDICLFVLIVEKNGQKIADNPENFAFLCGLLIKECQIFYKDKIRKIILDRHFFRESDQKRFNNYLKQLFDLKVTMRHLDSQRNPEINSADMVAGSILWKVTGKDKVFYRMIKKLIISEKIINWKEVKQRFFQKKTHRTGASAHPGEIYGKE